MKHKGFKCKILEEKGDQVYICRDNIADFEYEWVYKSEIESERIELNEEELYYSLMNCKEGTCYKCNRYNLKSSNTYPCKKQLLEDCFDWFDKYLNK
jgi:hypothetical protein